MGKKKDKKSRKKDTKNKKNKKKNNKKKDKKKDKKKEKKKGHARTVQEETPANEDEVTVDVIDVISNPAAT